MTIHFDVIDANVKDEKFIQSTNFILKGKIYSILAAICESGEKGLTTRQIADACDISVYAARNWLIKLEEGKYIYKICHRPRLTTWHAT